MSKLTNIVSSSTDPFNRYKMPLLVTKIEGKKLFFENLQDVAKALHVDVSWLAQFASYEFAAEVKADRKTNRFYVSGTDRDTKDMLDKFIALLVLCPNCGLPELTYQIRSSVKLCCSACGHESKVNSTHRIINYLTKQKKV